MREVAKLALKLGERLGKFGVLPQETGEILSNLSETDKFVLEISFIIGNNITLM